MKKFRIVYSIKKLKIIYVLLGILRVHMQDSLVTFLNFFMCLLARRSLKTWKFVISKLCNPYLVQ